VYSFGRVALLLLVEV